jgi:hypothetical protein
VAEGVGDLGPHAKGDHVIDKDRKQVKQEDEQELKRPDEAVKDLQSDKEDADAVKGGNVAAWLKT